MNTHRRLRDRIVFTFVSTVYFSLLSASTACGEERIPIWIDFDPALGAKGGIPPVHDPDDGLAFLCLALHERVEVVGITVGFGNLSYDNVDDGFVLGSDVAPRGFPRPVDESLANARMLAGWVGTVDAERGLALRKMINTGADQALSRAEVQTQGAMALARAVQRSAASGRKIHIYALGTLTNVAAAMDVYARLFGSAEKFVEDVGRVVVVGGGIGFGNVFPETIKEYSGARMAAEYNIARDPIAAKRIFDHFPSRSGQLVVTPLNVTMRVAFTSNTLARLEDYDKSDRPLARLVLGKDVGQVSALPALAKDYDREWFKKWLGFWQLGANQWVRRLNGMARSLNDYAREQKLNVPQAPVFDEDADVNGATRLLSRIAFDQGLKSGQSGLDEWQPELQRLASGGFFPFDTVGVLVALDHARYGCKTTSARLGVDGQDGVMRVLTGPGNGKIKESLLIKSIGNPAKVERDFLDVIAKPAAGTAAGTWTLATRAAPWSARGGYISAVFNGRLWMIGSGGGEGDKGDVWSSPDGVNWTLATRAAPWSARGGYISAVFNGRLW
ncbi:MAG: nucleoside hydrolase, partial [Planctomycetes bacterium]|nr:nucleoside hydrolase [Planctomycetota bacterium]